MTVRKISENRDHNGPIYNACSVIGARLFLTGSADRFVARWHPETLSQDGFAVKANKAVYSVAQIDNLVYVGDAEGGMHVCDSETAQELKYYTLHSKGLFDILADHQNKQVYTAGGEGSLGIWTGTEFFRQIFLSDQKLRALVLSKDGRTLYVAGNAGIIHALETDMFNEIQTAETKSEILSLALHPQKPVLLAGSKDAHLRFYKTENFELVREIPAHNFGVYDIAFSPDSSLCVSVSFDKTIKLWDATSFDVIRRIDHDAGGHSSSVNTVLWTGNREFITVGDDRRIISWAIDE